MSDEIKNEKNAYMNPALDVLDLLSEQLGAHRQSVPVSELWAARGELSDDVLTEGMRMLIERGAIEFRSGRLGPELAITGKPVTQAAKGTTTGAEGEG